MGSRRASRRLKSSGCHRPNEAALGVGAADRKRHRARNGADLPHVSANGLPALDLPSVLVGDPAARDSSGNTTETSHVDRPDESTPFCARLTKAGWRRRQSSSASGHGASWRASRCRTSCAETPWHSRSYTCRRTRLVASISAGVNSGRKSGSKSRPSGAVRM